MGFLEPINMNRRLNVEKKVENPIARLKIGTVNRLDPMALYIEGKLFISPIEKNGGYEKDMLNIERQFKYDLSSGLIDSGIFDGKGFIVDFDIPIARMKKGKKSFLSFQVVYRQNKLRCEHFDKAEAISEGIILNALDSLVSNLDRLGYSSSKTRSVKKA